MQDFRDTLISQYANSPTIVALLQAMDEWIDPTADFEAFFRCIWDLRTATGYGLDVWGRIVGIGRVIPVPTVEASFGFGEGNDDGDYTPFDDAPFVIGGIEYGNYSLSDDAYRALIFAKAASNIAATTAPAINRIISILLANRGRCYVSDLGGMTMRYTFEFALFDYELAIFTQTEVLPSTSGVLVQFVQT